MTAKAKLIMIGVPAFILIVVFQSGLFFGNGATNKGPRFLPDLVSKDGGDVHIKGPDEVARDANRERKVAAKAHVPPELAKYYNEAGVPVFAKGLETATEQEVESMDWLAKGKYVLEKNQDMLEHPAYQGDIRNITLISAMFDLGRGHIKTSENWKGFKRPFKYYIDKFRVFLKYKHPKIIYIQKEHYDSFKPYLDDMTFVIFKSLEEIRKFPYFDLVQKIRTSPNWPKQADWLGSSPQATMELYNPLVMSKMYWTRDAARVNPFNTDGFLFFDGAHLCNDPTGITPANMHLFKQHMDKVLITYFEYTPNTEIHGFSAKPFAEWIGTDELPMHIGRGGVFGGRRNFLEVTTLVYDIILSATLNAGFMGTEENIFALLRYRFIDLIHPYENGDGGNCAVFYETTHPKIDYDKLFKEKGYDLRRATCLDNGSRKMCKDDKGNVCAEQVTPHFLARAKNQGACEPGSGRFCTVTCEESTGVVKWWAHNCVKGESCPPYALASPANEGYTKTNDGLDATSEEDEESSADTATSADDESSDNVPVAGTHAEWEAKIFASRSEADTAALRKTGVNTRGLHCMIKNGEERCFVKDDIGRAFCPKHVNHAFLSKGANQHLCLPENSEKYYCTVACQDENPNIGWRAHEKAYCAKNDCPPEPKYVPLEDFHLEQYTELAHEHDMVCKHGDAEMLKDVTVAILTRGREIPTLRRSFKTWAKHGLLELPGEVLVYVNERVPEFDKFIEPFTKPPYKVKVLGDRSNHQIAWGLTWLVGNSTMSQVLFMEKDFRQVEDRACLVEQLSAGVHMINQGTAHVVRYRSRWKPGRPNWADRMFRGHEDDVWKGRQPNLGCNLYYWIEDPDKRWPDYFWSCHENPKMYCSKAYYCNWTNNPVLFKRSWWLNAYVAKFDKWTRVDPYENLEAYMNWEPDAWNDQKWIVAQGDGLFEHIDMNNFGMRRRR